MSFNSVHLTKFDFIITIEFLSQKTLWHGSAFVYVRFNIRNYIYFDMVIFFYFRIRTASNSLQRTACAQIKIFISDMIFWAQNTYNLICIMFFFFYVRTLYLDQDGLLQSSGAKIKNFMSELNYWAEITYTLICIINKRTLLLDQDGLQQPPGCQN